MDDGLGMAKPFVGFPNRRNCLSLEDAHKVLDRFPAESMYKYAALVVLYAGAREREVSELQVKDVNFGERVLVIRTRTGSRSIPMTDFLFQSLTHYKNILDFPGDSNGKFFRGYSRNEFSKSLRGAGEDSGVPFSVTGVVLRHTFACMLINAGYGLDRVCELMGTRTRHVTFLNGGTV